MDAATFIERLQIKGVALEARGDRIRFSPKSALTLEEIESLRQHKAEVLAHLRQKQEHTEAPTHRPPTECRNTLTPHNAHELPWECDPDSCYCWRMFGYPRICQGIPCRWVWPDGVADVEPRP